MKFKVVASERALKDLKKLSKVDKESSKNLLNST
jgi:mRNA-degrading endonuclease RelE of RelBE toxin-antitoxin system